MCWMNVFTNLPSLSRLIMRWPSGALMGSVVSEHDGIHVGWETVDCLHLLGFFLTYG